MSEKRRTERRQGPGGPGGPGGHVMAVEKPKDFKTAVRRLLKVLRPWRVKLILCGFLSALSAAIGIFGPKITGQATTAIFEGLLARVRGTGGIDFTRVAQVLLFLLGLYLTSALFSFLMQRLVAGVTADFSRSLRGDIGNKLHRIPVGYYEKTSVGDVLSRITNDVDAVAQNISNVFTQLDIRPGDLAGRPDHDDHHQSVHGAAGRPGRAALHGAGHAHLFPLSKVFQSPAEGVGRHFRPGGGELRRPPGGAGLPSGSLLPGGL